MTLNLKEMPRTNINCEPPTYQHATWKQMAFHVENSSDEFGRRIDVYEYPLGNDIGVKDLGRRARRFKIEGYLIGTDQTELSKRMAHEAESPEPGYLTHPMFGRMLVACITLTVTADYRRDKKRTKLVFEFVEAAESWAPFRAGSTIDEMWVEAMAAMNAAFATGGNQWNPSEEDLQVARDISTGMAGMMQPGTQLGWDAQDMLGRLGNYLDGLQPVEGSGWTDDMVSGVRPTFARDATAPIATTGWSPLKFANIIAPIDYASAIIRQFHMKSLETLRAFNAYVVSRSEASPSAQALVQTIRFIVIRDFAIAVAQTEYATITEALRDLDFVMAVYDDEEAIATQKCDDAVVDMARRARATAASAILQRNIRLPGIADYPVDGLWPSLVVANKLYFDGRRYEQVENYNPSMFNFWMGRNVIAPMR